MNNLGIPNDYLPYSKVWVCSNNFNKGQVILNVEGTPVFLIGRGGNDPLVWLNLPKPGKGRPEWKPAIVRSTPMVDGFEVHKSNYGLCVLGQNDLLIEFRVEQEVLVISAIDLRPIGLNVMGNMKVLRVSGMQLSENEFMQINTMVAIGGA